MADIRYASKENLRDVVSGIRGAITEPDGSSIVVSDDRLKVQINAPKGGETYHEIGEFPLAQADCVVVRLLGDGVYSCHFDQSGFGEIQLAMYPADSETGFNSLDIVLPSPLASTTDGVFDEVRVYRDGTAALVKRVAGLSFGYMENWLANNDQEYSDRYLSYFDEFEAWQGDLGNTVTQSDLTAWVVSKAKEVDGGVSDITDAVECFRSHPSSFVYPLSTERVVQLSYFWDDGGSERVPYHSSDETPIGQQMLDYVFSNHEFPYGDGWGDDNSRLYLSLCDEIGGGFDGETGENRWVTAKAFVATVTEGDGGPTVDTATSDRYGVVMIDGETIKVNSGGKLYANVSGGGGGVEPADSVPLADGTANVGTSDKYAREDHVHPAQTDVTGNAGTATKLQTARAIDGVAFDGSKAITHYGTCPTAAGTTAKVATLSDSQTFTLATGATVTIRFTYTNTYASPTLNVNGTGAKSIRYRNANLAAKKIVANGTYTFVYDGTYWQLVGELDTTGTTYSAINPVYGGTTNGLVKQSTLYNMIGVPEAVPAEQYYGYDDGYYRYISTTSTKWAATVGGDYDSMVYGLSRWDSNVGMNIYMPRSGAAIALRVEGVLLGTGTSPVTLTLNTTNSTGNPDTFPVVHVDGTPVTQIAERTVLLMTFDLIENYDSSTGVTTYDGRWIVHSGGSGGSSSVSGDGSWQWVNQDGNRYLAIVTED